MHIYFLISIFHKTYKALHKKSTKCNTMTYPVFLSRSSKNSTTCEIFDLVVSRSFPIEAEIGGDLARTGKIK